MDNKTNISIQKIYKLGVTNNNVLFSNDFFTFLVILFFMLIILYWYLHNQIAFSGNNWEKIKCDPKYIYFSGYIKPKGTMTAAETTDYNYRKCISRAYKEYINDLKNEYSIDDVSRRKLLKNEKEMYDFVFKNKKDKNKKLNIDIEEIQNNLNNSTKLTANSTLTYNYLRNIGIYLDQFDMFLGYINTYAKNYLTYLYLGHNSSGSNKATKVKKILDKYFDGPSFF